MCGVCGERYAPSSQKPTIEWNGPKCAHQVELQYGIFNADRADGGEAGDYFQQWQVPCSGPLTFRPCVAVLLCARRNRKAVTRPTDLLKVHPPFLYINWSSESGSQTHPSQSPRRPAISAIAKETKSHHQRVIFKTGTARQYEVRVALDRSNINLAANALTEDGEHW